MPQIVIPHIGPPELDAVAAGWRRDLGLDVRVLRLTRDEYLAYDDSDWLVTWTGWYPGYLDPEYFLRLLLQSDSATNVGTYADPHFDALIDAASRERDDRKRLELYHEADRYAVADQVAVIPIDYTSAVAAVKPFVHGWWEFGKAWPNFADLIVQP